MNQKATKSQQIDPETGSARRSALPEPGPLARAFFRCILFASATVFAAIVLGLAVAGAPLLRSALAVSTFLLLPLFVLSFAFVRSEPRLALIGFVTFIVLALTLAGIPSISE